jgi:ribosomal protein S18 acetylase RimI-like enzyme
LPEEEPTLRVRPLLPADGPWVEEFVRERWGDASVVVHGTRYLPAELTGFCAESGGRRVGLVTLHRAGSSCEVVTLDSLEEGRGVGRALLDAARGEALRRGCHRLWLVTTNDNLRALGFYQRYGFRLSALRPGAVDASRRMKPSIPAAGENGIPIRDELELEMDLRPGLP